MKYTYTDHNGDSVQVRGVPGSMQCLLECRNKSGDQEVVIDVPGYDELTGMINALLEIRGDIGVEP